MLGFSSGCALLYPSHQSSALSAGHGSEQRVKVSTQLGWLGGSQEGCPLFLDLSFSICKMVKIAQEEL